MSFVEPRHTDDATADDEALFDVGWEIPWHAKVLPVALAAAMAAAWLYFLATGELTQGMTAWAVSADALSRGRYETILLHMFAHGGLMHLLMNAGFLLALGPPLIARMGPMPVSWLKFAAFFLFSGLAGCAVYLALHPNGDIPMLGASGALCGLWGFSARLDPDGSGVMEIKSRKVWLFAKEFLKANAILIVLLTLPALLFGSGGGVAWEAHLGGALFGLLVGPRSLPKDAQPTALSPSESAAEVLP